MKNMTLPAKKCKFFFAICALLTILFASCEKNEYSTLYGGVESKPAWTVTSDLDMPTSMTAVIKVQTVGDKVVADSLVTSTDLLAAFIDEQCCGIATYLDGLFYLYIAGPTGNTNANAVTLRFWSAEFKNIFEATDAFLFVNDDQKGTVAEPFVPAFVVAK